MKKLLPLLMFLLIFSPKIAGSIDSMSMFCILVFFISFLVDRRLDFSPKVIKPTLLYILFGFIMIGYAVVLKAIYGLNDNYQVLRFGRVVINVLGIFGLVRLYKFYFDTNYGSKLLYHLWVCIICHGVLMVAMFFIPSLNQFVITQLVQMDEANRTFETRIEGKRIGGLTNTWDAASGIQSLGILLLPFVFQYSRINNINRKIIYFSIPISLIAVFISGVTGIVNIFLVLMILFLFNFNILKIYFFKFMKLSLLALISIFLLIFMLKTFSLSEKEWIVDTSIGRTLFMITQDETFYAKSRRGITADETVNKISQKMYFIPDNDVTFFFGKGGSGRSSDYVIKADPGPVLNLHNLGIFFVIITYGYCIYLLLFALNYCKIDLFTGVAISAVLLTILIIDAKVMYLLARQSLSIMLIAYFVLFWAKGRMTNKD